MSVSWSKRVMPSDAERQRRKRYLTATLVTCAALAMFGGALHVVELGSIRMEKMRNKAAFDLSQEKDHIRAAGEDLVRNRLDEERKLKKVTYTVAEADALLTPEQWKELGKMIEIPAGSFTMGTDRERSDLQDHPRHVVKLLAYRIDKYPVTNAQYARFVAATGYRSPLNWKNGHMPDGTAMQPVTMVSWFDARNYAKWAGKRLPTEAEWEKAARGTDGRRWPWGNTMAANRLNTYYSVGSTTDVTKYPDGASPFGVMEMAGNVSEWTADDFKPYPGTDAPPELFQGKVGVANSPKDRAMKVIDLVPVDALYKVLRGGSWKSDPFSTATYHRNYTWPNYASDFFGFRCARDAASAGKDNS